MLGERGGGGGREGGGREGGREGERKRKQCERRKSGWAQIVNGARERDGGGREGRGGGTQINRGSSRRRSPPPSLPPSFLPSVQVRNASHPYLPFIGAAEIGLVEGPAFLRRETDKQKGGRWIKQGGGTMDRMIGYDFG